MIQILRNLIAIKVFILDCCQHFRNLVSLLVHDHTLLQAYITHPFVSARNPMHSTLFVKYEKLLPPVLVIFLVFKNVGNLQLELVCLRAHFRQNLRLTILVAEFRIVHGPRVVMACIHRL